MRPSRLVIPALALLLLAPSASAAPMQSYPVHDAFARQAICNDGTKARYYFRPGSGDGATRFVIHLKGGGGCTDMAECEARDRDLTSGLPWRQGRSFGGILSDDPAVNPDFHDWNHVFIPYCSSDSWVGTADQVTSSGAPWYFRGHFIVRAVVEDLTSTQRHPAPNLAHATEVLFSGSSAGAAGLRHNIDDLAALVQSLFAFPGKAQVIAGVSDAAFSPDGPLAVDFGGGQASKFQFWGAVPDASCTAHLSPANHWKCLSLEALMTLDAIETDLFVVMDQHDPLAMTNRGLDKTDSYHDKHFALGVRAKLMATQIIPTSVTGIYSDRRGRHVHLTHDNAFSGTHINGLSLADAIGNWFFDRPGPVIRIKQ